MDYGYHAWMLVAASLVLMMTAPRRWPSSTAA